MKIGFIGAGNMATAILLGALKSGFVSEDEITIYDVNKDQYRHIRDQFPNVRFAESQEELLRASDCILLAVKPIFLSDVLQTAKAYLDDKLVISIAAGWNYERLCNAIAPAKARVLRVMPNTPALVGEGFTALCENTTFDERQLAWAKSLFATLGTVAVLPERLFHAVVAVSGSSPAYAFMFMEAMADGAVRLGMPRDIAYRAAAQALLGSAKMVLETGEHPGKLKDNVCSPGGTTIDAVYALEKAGFRSAVMDAVAICAQKSAEMETATTKGKA